MKKILSLAFILVVAGYIISCKKVNKLTQFDINYSNNVTIPSATFTVPANPASDTLSVPFEFETAQIPTDAANKFNAQKTSAKLIDEIKLTKFNMTVSTGNFDAVKSISIFFKSAELGDVLIAKKTNIPAGTKTIETEVQDVNIKEYVFKESMQFKIVTRMKAVSRQEQLLTLDETLHVKASLIK